MLGAPSWLVGQQGRTKKPQGPVTPLPLYPSGPRPPRQPQRQMLSAALNPAQLPLHPLTSGPCHLPLCAFSPLLIRAGMTAKALFETTPQQHRFMMPHFIHRPSPQVTWPRIFLCAPGLMHCWHTQGQMPAFGARLRNPVACRHHKALIDTFAITLTGWNELQGEDTCRLAGGWKAQARC